MRGLLLPQFACMGGEGMVESLPVDVLGVLGQMGPDGCRKIVIEG